MFWNTEKELSTSSKYLEGFKGIAVPDNKQKSLSKRFSGVPLDWVVYKHSYLEALNRWNTKKLHRSKKQSPAASSCLIFNWPKSLYEPFVKC